MHVSRLKTGWPVTVIGLCVSLLSARPSFGWNETGHQVVAQIAYRQLTPVAKKTVDALIKAHPQYKLHLLDTLPKKYDNVELYAFMRAASWPDTVRSESNPLNKTYDRPKWHYIDIPYFPNEADIGKIKLPEAAAEHWDGSSEPVNLIQAIEKNAAEVKDTSIKPLERGVALSFLIHLYGDIHQPLHATTLYSSDYVKGDAGGNAAWVTVNGVPVNLHTIWDNLLGPGFQQPQMYKAITVNVLKDRGREKFAEQLKVTDYAAWAKSTHDLAVSNVYLNGKLADTNSYKWIADETLPLPEVPADYVLNATNLSKDQIALAGHRLADFLNAALTEEPPTTQP